MATRFHPLIAATIFGEKPEELFGYLVDPMQVLQHQNKRPPMTALYGELSEGFESLRLMASGLDSAGEPVTSLISSR
jgi:hypothetical protein